MKEQVKLFAFDLDGTLYIGNQAVADGPQLVATLRRQHKIAFFTNNSSRTASEIQKKLVQLGYPCEVEEIYTSSDLAAQYLEEAGLNDVYVIGSESFRASIRQHGIRVVDDETAVNVVVGLDLQFNYDKIAVALSILRRGGKFIACNEDASYPVGTEKYAPGCGAMVGAIVGCTQRRPDFIVGKPNTYIMSVIAKKYALRPQEIVVIGDSYESDIQMAMNFGCQAVLFGSYQMAGNSNLLVMESHKQILSYFSS